MNSEIPRLSVLVAVERHDRQTKSGGGGGGKGDIPSLAPFFSWR